MGHQASCSRPCRWTRRRTLNSRGLLMTVSMRSTQPNLSYIFSQLFLTRCLTRAPGQRSFLQSVSTSPSKRGCRRRPRNVKMSWAEDRKSTRLNSSHLVISYAVFCLKKKTHTCPSAIAAFCAIPPAGTSDPTLHSSPPSLTHMHPTGDRSSQYSCPLVQPSAPHARHS